LIQEGLRGAYESLRAQPDCEDRFIKNNIRWQMLRFARKGKSVDSDVTGFERRNRHIEIVKTDALTEDVAEMVLTDKSSIPVDEKVIAMVCWERFLKTLTRIEKKFINLKLKETDRFKMHKIMGQLTYLKARKDCRVKFNRAFDVAA